MNFANFIGDRAVVAGVALSGPVIVGALPTWVMLLTAAPWLLSVALRPTIMNFREIPAFVYCIIAITIMHAASLVFTSTPFVKDVARDAILAGGCAVVYLSVCSDRSRVVTGFFAIVAPLAVVVSTLGLVKFAFQKSGYVFEPIVSACGYIAVGTTFCGDYNMYSLFLLIGAIGVSVAHFKTPSLLHLVCLFIVITAGFFAGSRRFIFLLPLIPAMWMIVGYHSKSLSRYIPQIAIVFLSLAAVVWLTPSGVYQAHTVIGFSVTGGVTSSDASDQPIGPTELTALLGSMSETEQYGLGSRTDRWKLAAKTIVDSPFTGQGFSYHEIFSCEFVKCRFIDYPHAPVLSSWIIGGVFGLGLAVLFYGLTLYMAWTNGVAGIQSGATATVFAVLPYSLLSGDTVFSLPAMVASALLLCADTPSSHTARQSKISFTGVTVP